MKQEYTDRGMIKLECTIRESATLWYAVEYVIKDLEEKGIQDLPAYERLKSIEAVLSGKGGASDEEAVV